MIVKCMRPQNPNFSEEKMGLISAKKSIKTMVPYNGPALVEGSVLVGRTIIKTTARWFFCIYQKTLKYLKQTLYLKYEKILSVFRFYFFTISPASGDGRSVGNRC